MTSGSAPFSGGDPSTTWAESQPPVMVVLSLPGLETGRLNAYDGRGELASARSPGATSQRLEAPL
jgi:hypothetical protein